MRRGRACPALPTFLRSRRHPITTEVIDSARHRSLAFDWRGWFFVGLVVGGAVFALIAGGPDFHGYGWLTDTFSGSSRIWIAPILLVAGVAIGYGAKLAGGCTSGNGLSGTSSLSPAAFAATATFFTTAIAVSFVIKALI